MAPRDYWLYEAGPVRPVALSHDRERLYVANIPDGHLEVFAVTRFGLAHLGSVPVGLEPVSVAVSPDDSRVWVVNHLSDSISIVNVAAKKPYIEHTLLVGDEPRDIVFAGQDFSRVFVTTAHRGQNHPQEPRLTTPAIGRADVWVFDADMSNSSAPAEPIAIVNLFGDTPRGLAASVDGQRVFAAIFRSGNRTTALRASGFDGIPKPLPDHSADGVSQPVSGLIIREVGGNWIDELGRPYNINMELPDLDVFEIDAVAETPQVVRSLASVGTTLFNLAVNPINDDVYVSNIEALNHVRFSGHAVRANTRVRGHVADHRISVIHGGQVLHHDLNPHLNYSATEGTPSDRELSLSMPMGVEVSAGGEHLYLAAYGSSEIVVYDTTQLQEASANLTPVTRYELNGGGPAGFVLDEDRMRLYVLMRFDNTLRVIGLANGQEKQSFAMFNPEPVSVTTGRKFLYDARLTSGFGNDSCHTCHLFGDNDALAWDLGEPDGTVKQNPGLGPDFHPMKGPMTTQSLRGLPRHGPQHWRGDRTGQSRSSGDTLEEAAFKEFNEAFDKLQALNGELGEDDMQAFTDFAMQLTYPPNPVRALDNSLTPEQAQGLEIFQTGRLAGVSGSTAPCIGCHTLDVVAGVFGTNGVRGEAGQSESQAIKIPHFRDLYQKVGRFESFFDVVPQPQVRGFGFEHNGAQSLESQLFIFGPEKEERLWQYLFTFPSESSQIIGQQLTVNRDRLDDSMPRLLLLMEQANVSNPLPLCDLVVQSIAGNARRSWAFDREASQFVPARPGTKLSPQAMLDRIAETDRPHTFTCVPWGSGNRIGLDRDRDGILDEAEVRQGSNPADPDDFKFRAQPGMWWDPTRPGEGLDLEFGGSNLAMTWFTFDENGDATWYQAVGDSGQDWQADLLKFKWTAQLQEAEFEIVGSVSISFHDAKSAEFDWTIGAHSGSQLIERFRIDARPTALRFTGLWHDPQQPGYGLTLDTQGETCFGVLYFYDQSDDPRWVIIVHENETEAEVDARSVTGSCPWCEFEPTLETPAGNVRLEFESLFSATVDIDVFFANPDEGRWQREEARLERLTTSSNYPEY